MKKINRKMLTAYSLIALLCAGCTNPTDSARTLRSAGYTSIKTGDYAWFACGNGDNYATKFTAKNPAGRSTSGVVCCGLVKSCTIRH